MLDRDNNFYLIHLNTLVTSFLDGGWKLKGEVTCESLLGFKGLIKNQSNEITITIIEVQWRGLMTRQLCLLNNIKTFYRFSTTFKLRRRRVEKWEYHQIFSSFSYGIWSYDTIRKLTSRGGGGVGIRAEDFWGDHTVLRGNRVGGISRRQRCIKGDFIKMTAK